MDEPSLSEHEQRILEEIERNLAAEDPVFARKVRDPRLVTGSPNVLRLGILALVVGFGLLLGYTVHVALGLLGFLLMLAGAVGVGISVRGSGSSRMSGERVRGVIKRAEGKLRPKRRDKDT